MCYPSQHIFFGYVKFNLHVVFFFSNQTARQTQKSLALLVTDISCKLFICNYFQYASDNSKYYPHPHHGVQISHRMVQLMLGCLCFGVLLILVNIYQLHSITTGQTVGDPEFGSSRRPVVWMNARNVRILVIFKWVKQLLVKFIS